MIIAIFFICAYYDDDAQYLVFYNDVIMSDSILYY